MLHIAINGIPWGRTSLEAIEDANAGLGWIAYPSGGGAFAPLTDSTGAQKFRTYPSPTSAGLPITAECVGKPPAFDVDTLTATTVFPDDSDRALVDYARAIVLGGVEDNAALRDYYMGKFDEEALELRRLRIGRLGRGPRRVPIIGVTA